MGLARAFEALDFGTLMQARLALDMAGIPYHVEGESRGGTDALSAMSSTMIWVPDERLDEAVHAIDAFLHGRSS